MAEMSAAPLKIYIGCDPRDGLAYQAAVASIVQSAAVPLEIYPLHEHLLRQAGVYWREYRVEASGQMVDLGDGRPFSTQFAFTRFLVPYLARAHQCVEPDEWVLFLDADVLVRKPLTGLLDILASPVMDHAAVACVQHAYTPTDTEKMGGLSQVIYQRKNWSSVMALRPSRLDQLTPHLVNTASGAALHSLAWVEDAALGALDPAFNWLEGWHGPDLDPVIAHYTRGTPDQVPTEMAFADEWWQALSAYRPLMGEAER
jgi:hypothetical protein